jgi:hypothetical protein
MGGPVKIKAASKLAGAAPQTVRLHGKALQRRHAGFDAALSINRNVAVPNGDSHNSWPDRFGGRSLPSVPKCGCPA